VPRVEEGREERRSLVKKKHRTEDVEDRDYKTASGRKRERERERERDHEVESNQKKRERTFYKNVEFRNLSLLLLSMLSSAVPHICTW
jgi:hypothetical protein